MGPPGAPDEAFLLLGAREGPPFISCDAPDTADEATPAPGRPAIVMSLASC